MVSGLEAGATSSTAESPSTANAGSAAGQHDAVGAPLDEPAGEVDEIGAIGGPGPVQLDVASSAFILSTSIPPRNARLGEGSREVGHDGDRR